jgi:hypothetical protein
LNSVRTPNLRLTAPTWLMRGWKYGARQNVMPARSRHARAAFPSSSTRTPKAASTSALPLRLDMARLPCLTTGTPAPAATRAVAVLMLNVLLPSPPVPQVSSTSSRPDASGTQYSRSTAAAAANSSGVSPFMCSATNSAAVSNSPHAPFKMSCIN